MDVVLSLVGFKEFDEFFSFAEHIDPMSGVFGDFIIGYHLYLGQNTIWYLHS